MRKVELRKLEDLLFDKCGWHPKQLLRTTVCTNGYRTHPKNAREADSDILNSFHVPDILGVKSALNAANGRGWNNVGAGLCNYLNGIDPATRIDVRRAGLEQTLEGTMPAMMPLARWPSRHPLSFAQQFAVNRIIRDLDDAAGIFSVNGPPGTGKTTLLRDIVAAVVFRRAEALAKLRGPNDGFGSQSTVLNVNKQYVWPLKASLSGFGMVVASSNNGAVENVSKELPASKSIDAPGVSIDYFSPVADGLIADKDAVSRREGAAWGMIAAVLGNRDNCGRFVRRFWGERADGLHDDETPEADELDDDPEAPDVNEQDEDESRAPSLDNDLVAIADILSTVGLSADEGGDTGFVGFAAALEAIEPKPWNQAVQEFLEARKRVQTAIDEADSRARAFDKLIRYQSALSDAEARHAAAASMLAREKPNYDEACARLPVADQEFKRAALRKALAVKLQQGQDRLTSVELERPIKIAAEVEQKLCQIDTEIGRHDDKVKRTNAYIENEKLLRPGWLARVFLRARSKAWNDRFEALIQEQRSAGEAKADQIHQRENHKAMLRTATDWQIKHQDALRRLDEARDEAVFTFGQPISSVTQADNMLAEAKRLREHVDKISQECIFRWNELSKGLALAKSGLKAVRGEADRRLAVVQGLGVTETQRNDWDLRYVDDETRQLRAPWHDQALWSLRDEAFIAALELHKAFLYANSGQVVDNLEFLSKVMTGTETARGIRIPMRNLWDTLFLAVPVVSTAFASMPRLFSTLGAEELGWLIVDEAGQATPQAALGSIWRARRSVIVGDPLQIEPVVEMPEAAIEMIREKFNVGYQWHPIANSAQVIADRANKWGTYLGDGADGLWLGSPLRVHRRCIDPMFRVANQIAYDGMMVYGTSCGDEESDKSWLRKSAWINVGSERAEGHWIPAQGTLAAAIVHAVIAQNGCAFTEDGKANVYIVSPFKAAADGIKDLLKDDRHSNAAVDAAKHVHRIAGTVHTFQGKEADTVVILLGGDPTKPGARSGFAARAPNLLNVALTRAKRRVYVVGDHRLWSKEKYFNVLAANLPLVEPKPRDASPDENPATPQ